MKKKLFQITAAIFDDPKLTKCMDILARLSPAETVNEAAIRRKDRQAIAEGNLGAPVQKPCANRNGTLDRDRILTGTTLFGDKPHITENDIKRMAEGGFDFVISENRGAYGKQIADWCQQYHLAVIDDGFRETVQPDIRNFDEANLHMFQAYTPHPASVGNPCWDEPTYPDFGALGKFHSAYQKVFPNRFLFSNLLPGLALTPVLGINSYAKYIDGFSKTVPTDYISADIYPFHPSKVMNKFEMAVCLHTYHCIGNACRRDNKDFWLYIQSQRTWFAHLYTATTFEMVKWQAYASLCYGCRSIIHASYNPVWGKDAVGMIDYNGNLTEQYLYAKRVNEEIANLSPVIKDYRSLGVQLIPAKKRNSHFALAERNQKRNNRLQGFGGIPAVENIRGEHTALAGYFANKEGKNALLLVNCQNIYDPYATQSITLTFAKSENLGIYEHGKLTRKETAKTLTVKIGSCDGIFITLG